MKRALSLVITIAMVLTLLPLSVAFASYEELREPVHYEYLFNNASHGLGGNINNLHSGNHALSKTAEGYDKWGLVNLYNTAVQFTNASHLAFGVRGEASPVFTRDWSASGARSAIGFEIQTDSSGVFDAAITFVTDPSSPVVDVLIFKAPADRSTWDIILDDPNHVNSASMNNFYSNAQKVDYIYRVGAALDLYGNGEEKTFDLRPVTLEANTSYFVVIAGAGNNPNAAAVKYSNSMHWLIYLKSLSLSERISSDAKALRYVFGTDVISEKLPIVSSNGRIGTGIYSKADDGIPDTLYNLAYANWKKTDTRYRGAKRDVFTTDEANPYYTLDLNKTAPYAIEIYSSKNLNIGCNSYVPKTGLQATCQMGTFTEKSASTRMHIPIRVYIPSAGTYALSTVNKFARFANEAFCEIYFGDAPEMYAPADIDSLKKDYANIGWFSCGDLYANDSSAEGGIRKVSSLTVEVPHAGEYYILFDTSAESLTHNSTPFSATATWQYFNLSEIVLTPVSARANAAEALNNAVEKEMKAAVYEKSAPGTVATGSAVSAVAAYIGGEAEADVISVPQSETGKPVTVTAPKKDGYRFLYWAKGLDSRKIVLSDKESMSFIAASGANRLIAVYMSTDDAVQKAEFFGGNGEFVASADIENGAVTLPSLPAIPGYGKASGWVLYGDAEKTLYAEGASVEVSAGAMFVAAYNDLSESVNITVTGGTADKEICKYGDTVTVTAPERKNGTGAEIFNYWKRDGEIVSFDREYSFTAYKNCRVEAVYSLACPSISEKIRKIILGSFSTGKENAVMAEFIGMDGAIEKGIMFGTNKTAMKTAGDMFTMTDDDETNDAVGYAIFSDGSIIYSK